MLLKRPSKLRQDNLKVKRKLKEFQFKKVAETTFYLYRISSQGEILFISKSSFLKIQSHRHTTVNIFTYSQTI